MSANRSSRKIWCACREARCWASTSTRSSPGSGRRWHCLLRLDRDLHATILLPPFRIVAAVGLLIRRDRLLRAESLCLELGAAESTFRSEPIADCVRPALGQRHVVC